MSSIARDNKLQALCRDYLLRLRGIAARYGLAPFIDDTIADNRQGKCKGTEEECRLLARCVDDERIVRTDVPKILGKCYGKCFDAGDFEKVDKLPHVGIYSKVSAILYGEELKEQEKP